MGQLKVSLLSYKNQNKMSLEYPAFFFLAKCRLKIIFKEKKIFDFGVETDFPGEKVLSPIPESVSSVAYFLPEKSCSEMIFQREKRRNIRGSGFLQVK